MRIKNPIFLICVLIGSLHVIDLRAQDTYSTTDSIAFIRDFEATQRKNAIISIEKEGGKIATHILDRGENLEYIARYYGADPLLLKMLNTGYSNFYCGEEILIPVFDRAQQASVSTENSNTDHHIKTCNVPLYQNGFRYLENGDHKNAIRIFNKLVKEDGSVTAYYGRACAYSKLKKHRQATNDLRHVIQNDTKNLFPEAEDLFGYESAIWEQQKEERRQLVGQIIGSVLQAGAQVGQAYLQSKYGNSVPSWNLSSFSSYSSPAYPIGAVSAPGAATFTATGVGGATFEIPAALDYTHYLNSASFQPQFTTDAYGNMMVSYPGLAASMMNMQNEFNNYMNSSGLLSSGTASANALIGMMNLNNQTVFEQASFMNTPMYPEAYATMAGSDDYNDSYQASSTTTTTAGTNTSSKCPWCNGTGRITVNQTAPPNMGNNLGKAECPECHWVYDKSLYVHSHHPCRHCKKH